MSLVTTLWSMQAAAALTLAVLYGVVWSVDRRNLANLTLCVVAVAMAFVARAEVGMMHATTVAEYGDWARLCYLPLSVALSDNPNTRPLIDGDVMPEGIGLTPTAIHPSEMFWRQLRFAEFDVSDQAIWSLIRRPVSH